MKNYLENRIIGIVFLVFLAISLPSLADQHKHSHHKKTHTSNHKVVHSNKSAHKNNHKSLKVIGGSEPVYVVQPGDVFSKIAQKYQPAGVSLKKVMKTIYAQNRHAFVNGDQKRVIVGAKLRIPSMLTKVTESSEKVKSESKPVLSEAVSSKSTLRSTPELQKKLPNKSDAGSLLEDDPQNPKSQTKTIGSTTIDSAKTAPVPNQINPELGGSNIDSPAIVAAGQIPPAPVTKAELSPPRRDTGLNGFVLIGMCLFVLALIIFWRLRSIKIQKAQRELVDKMMSQNNS